MGTADTGCEQLQEKAVKRVPRVVVRLDYNDEVILIKGNNQFTLRIDADGHLIGTQEKEVKL